MPMTLALDDLQVETFSTSDEPAVAVGAEEVKADWSETCNVTLYVCSCGCGTEIDCPSGGPRCTLACVEPSNATDYIACCG